MDAAYADAACAACHVLLEARVHSGEIVDVYRGRSRETARPLAVKLTRARWRGHRGAARLVAREYRVLAALDHPHVVSAPCFAERDGVAALVTEYLPGGDLVPLAGESPARWVPAARDVVSALDAVHAAGRMHGDVKARNVRLDGEGRAKLIDFGSAQPIGAPRARGGRTRAHEPLRFELGRVSPVEDVYALAVLLYELLTARLPFGPAPVGFSPPAPISLRAPAGRAPALTALAARVTATLEAETLRDVGTLIEFADVLESVHVETAEPA